MAGESELMTLCKRRSQTYKILEVPNSFLSQRQEGNICVNNTNAIDHFSLAGGSNT